VVNNVETLCCAARILERGPAWFAGHGSPASTGTKLLSVSGDCRRPGVYEHPFGIPLADVLEAAGGEGAAAVQVGGPSGRMVGVADFGRTVDFEHLATGGSIMVFGAERDIVDIALQFTKFFAHESCGYCTPCRVGTALLEQGLRAIKEGRAEPADLDRLAALADTVRSTSRCGLGQTAANPFLSSLASFRSDYEGLAAPRAGGLARSFDIQAALSEGRRIAGRDSVYFGVRDEGSP
jgi:[NiFe] hydrogenase diaphorase moiety large subunit